MRILGIDPGSRFTGYGVLEVEGQRETVVEYGVLNVSSAESHVLRLKHIYERLDKVVERCLPDECAIEMPVYGRNPQSMLKLGRAQATAMLVALNREVAVTEYTPAEVKKSVTGNGNASKQQIWYMVRSILSIKGDEEEMGLDASDALAVALCHAHRGAGSSGGTTRHKDWSSFVQANQDRVS